MHRCLVATAATALLACATGSSVAHSGNHGSLSANQAIERFCDDVLDSMQNKQAQVFASLKLPESDFGPWGRYESSDSLSGRSRTAVTVREAQVWERDDHALIVELSTWSHRGDILEIDRCCYRTNGTLARLHSMQINHSGPTVIERIRLFSEQGRELSDRGYDTTNGAVRTDVTKIGNSEPYMRSDLLPFRATP